MTMFDPYFYFNPYYPAETTQRVARRAYAPIKGGPLAPSISGFVVFTSVPNGTEVFVELRGLPAY